MRRRSFGGGGRRSRGAGEDGQRAMARLDLGRRTREECEWGWKETNGVGGCGWGWWVRVSFSYFLFLLAL